MKVVVAPTIKEAQSAVRQLRRSVLYRPLMLADQERVLEDVGDAAWYYPDANDEKEGAVVFIRRNLVMHIVWEEAEPGAGLALVRQIDRLIRDDRKIAPLGRFDPVPAIADTGIPKVLRVRKARLVEVEGKAVRRPRTMDSACVRIEPKFVGLGPREKIRFWVTSEPGLVVNQVAQTGFSIPNQIYVPVGEGAVRVARPSAEDDGRFILRIKVPAERTTCKLTLTAVNDMNVIVTKEVEVVIEPVR